MRIRFSAATACIGSLGLVLAAAAAAEGSKLDNQTVARAPARISKQVNIASGQPFKLVDVSGDPASDCTIGNSGPPVRIIQLPTHGAALVQSFAKTVNYPPQNPLSSCNGKSVPGITVIYRSDEGFKGSDSIVIGFEQNGGITKMAYLVTVA